MARIRTVKPEFFTSKSMSSVSPYARLLAVALMQRADKDGRMTWLTMQVHADSFPHEPDVDVEALAEELEGIGYLVRYEVDGKDYAEIPKFSEHQRITGKEAGSESRLPGRPRDTGVPSQGNNGESPGCFPEKYLDARGKGKGKGSTPTGDADASSDPKSVIFTAGLRLLTDAGKSQSSARSHLGKLCKAHGDQTVADAVQETIRAGPVEPGSYLERLCRGASADDLLRRATGGIPWN